MTPERFEEHMKQWDRIRCYVETLPGASLPRDMFENVIETVEEEAQREAYEKAAKVCERHENSYLAAAIRRLAEAAK